MSTARKANCQHCGTGFDWYAFSPQWDRLWCAYCERCGFLALSGNNVSIADRPDFPSCRCGGRFSPKAVPRCPSCRKEVRPSPAAWIVIDGRVAMELGGKLTDY